MRHDPNNSLCDKNAYAGMGGDHKCTCDVDDAEDAPAPSTVLPPDARNAGLGSGPTGGAVTLTGGAAAAWVEFQAASREYDAARALIVPAEQRLKAAIDRLGAEAVRR